MFRTSKLVIEKTKQKGNPENDRIYTRTDRNIFAKWMCYWEAEMYFS